MKQILHAINKNNVQVEAKFGMLQKDIENLRSEMRERANNVPIFVDDLNKIPHDKIGSVEELAKQEVKLVSASKECMELRQQLVSDLLCPLCPD